MSKVVTFYALPLASASRRLTSYLAESSRRNGETLAVLSWVRPGCGGVAGMKLLGDLKLVSFRDDREV